LLSFLIKQVNLYSILDRPLHSQRNTHVKYIQEESTDDVSQADTVISTITTTTPIHNQQHTDEYVNELIHFPNSKTMCLIFFLKAFTFHMKIFSRQELQKNDLLFSVYM
jgi:hypothetical protein